MPSPAEMPQRDEALKSLVTRFQEAPSSRAFVELASALLSRGHASEALRIAEHGLQLVPDSVDGRVERAASLLALGRPRVAYVELLRALAIHPRHKRGMRLLGKAFVDAGAPHRAAELLAQRSGRDARGSSSVEARPPAADAWKKRPSIQPDPPPPAAKDDDVPALFSALTKDLGLGGAMPARTAPRRVEVTQIMRRRAMPRPPRSASELVEIDGPIVDNTQPGHILESDLDEPPGVTMREPAPLWNEKTPGLTDFALDDEPLFQEHMPFAVRPVAAESMRTPAGGIEPITAPSVPEVDDSGDTVVDEIEDSDVPFEPMNPSPSPSPMSLSDMASPPPLKRSSPPPLRKAPLRASVSDLALPPAGSSDETEEVEPTTAPLTPAQPTQRSAAPERASPTAPMAQRPDPRAPTGLLPPPGGAAAGLLSEDRPFEAVGARVEKSKRKEIGLEVVEPPTSPARLALAAVAILGMALYLAGLLWVSSDALSAWWDPEAKGSITSQSPVDSEGARAQRAE